jgi:Zn-dependent protease with chaperone function
MTTTGDQTAQGYRPVPGPADRTTFFEAQRRHRRASRRFSAIAAIAVLLTGMPLSIVLTPFVYAVVLVGGYAAAMFSPLPAAAWQIVKNMPFVFLTASGLVAAAEGKTNVLTPTEALALAVALVLPGALILLSVWIGLRLVFRHAGVGGVLLTLNTRVPNINDLEERRLVNLVEEMSVAAGVTPPRVMLIDADAAAGAANAAAVGWSIADATIIVTRPLLARLKRDEIQAIIGRLIGSVGNGDLKIALIILSLFQTVGVAVLTLNAFFGWQARRALWRLLRLALTPTRSRNRAARESDVMAMLAQSATANSDMTTYMETHQRTGCLAVLQLPLMLGVGFPIMTSNFIVAISTAVFTGPIIGLMWKRRQLLADATAVQLTRNPDGLAAAIERLQELSVRLPRSDSISHLFAVWNDSQGLSAEQRAALANLMARSGPPLERARAVAALRATQRAEVRSRRQARQASDSESAGSTLTTLSRYMHIKPERRLKQLRALGAQENALQRPDVTPAAALRTPALHHWVLAVVLITPLVLLLGGLLGTAFLLFMGLDLLFMALMLMFVWGVCHFVFVSGPTLWRKRQ